MFSVDCCLVFLVSKQRRLHLRRRLALHLYRQRSSQQKIGSSACESGMSVSGRMSFSHLLCFVIRKSLQGQLALRISHLARFYTCVLPAARESLLISLFALRNYISPSTKAPFVSALSQFVGRCAHSVR